MTGNYYLSKNIIQAPHLIMFILTLTILTCACGEKQMNSEIILIEEGDFMYPAKVTKAYTEKDSQIHVYIFNDTIRKKIGNAILSSKLAAKRAEPPKGWGTRLRAIQYFWQTEWIYAEDATEFEDHYLIPINNGDDRKIELKHIRFPIPIQR